MASFVSNSARLYSCLINFIVNFIKHFHFLSFALYLFQSILCLSLFGLFPSSAFDNPNFGTYTGNSSNFL